MQWLRNLAVSRKMVFAFGIVCGLCVIMGAYTFLVFRGIASQCSEVSKEDFTSVVNLDAAREAMNTLRNEDLYLMICQTPECVGSHSRIRQQALDSYQASLRTYEQLVVSAEERALYQKMSASFAQYQEISNRGVELVKAGKSGDALDVLSGDSTLASFSNALTATNSVIEMNVEHGTKASQGATNSATRATWVGSALVLLIIVLCAVTGVILTREIAPRIERLKNAIQAMAQKDLSVQVRVSGTDEIGSLGEAFNASVASIRSVLQSVAQSADTLSSATTEISTRSVQSASNAHTQSSKINLIATAATQQTSASSEISESAGQISQLSNETAQGAEEAVATLKNLAELAADLDGMIRQFHLEEDKQAGGRFGSSAQSLRQPALRTAHS